MVVVGLIVDLLRRKWKGAALGGFQLWSLRALWSIFPSIDQIAVSMITSLFASFMMSRAFDVRELYQLPVSRRTWWLTRWLLQTVVASAFVQVFVALAEHSIKSEWPSAELTALSVLWSTLYCAAAVGAPLFADKPIKTTTGMAIMAIGSLPVVLLAIAMPLLIGASLPHAFAQFNVIWLAVLSSAVAAAYYSFSHTPAITPRAVIRPLVTIKLDGVDRPNNWRGSKRFQDGLTGLPLFFWTQLRTDAAAYVFILLIFAIGWAISLALSQTSLSLPAFLSESSLLPLHDSEAAHTAPFTFGFMLFAVCMPESFNNHGIRSLRRLPLGTNQLSLLPVALGIASTAMLWLIFLILQLLTTFTLPITARVDLLIASAGALTMARTSSLLGGSSVSARGLTAASPFALFLLALLIAEWRSQSIRPVLLFGGMACLVLSVVISRWLVGRGKRIYRPVMPVRFGV